MKQYGVKFFEIENKTESEVEMDALPDDYISGLIKMLKDDLISRERMNRVCKRIADNIKDREWQFYDNDKRKLGASQRLVRCS